MADIVDLRATGFGALYEVDFLHLRGIERENDFHADTKRDFADRDGWRGALPAFFGNNHAFEDLEALLAAFFDFAGDADDIAGSNGREVGSSLGEIECDEFLVHIGSVMPRKKNHPSKGLRIRTSHSKRYFPFRQQCRGDMEESVSTRRKSRDTLGER